MQVFSMGSTPTKRTPTPETTPELWIWRGPFPKYLAPSVFSSGRRPPLSYFHQEVGKKLFGTLDFPSVAHLSNERGNVLINKCFTLCYRGLIDLKGPRGGRGRGGGELLNLYKLYILPTFDRQKVRNWL